MGALTNSFSLVLSLFPTKPFCFHKMAFGVGGLISVVGPLEQLGGQLLAEPVGLQQR
jgi:hypothetical protein